MIFAVVINIVYLHLQGQEEVKNGAEMHITLHKN